MRAGGQRESLMGMNFTIGNEIIQVRQDYIAKDFVIHDQKES